MTTGLVAVESVAVNAAEIGQLLRKGRTQKNMSVDDLARELHLQVRQINALERGDFSGFSGPAFVKGHLRACARLFALDGDALVHLYEAGLPQPTVFTPAPPVLATKIVKAPSQGRRSGLVVVALLILVALLVVWIWSGWYVPFRAIITDPVASVVTTTPAGDGLSLPDGMPSLGDALTSVSVDQVAAGTTEPAPAMPVADLPASPTPVVPSIAAEQGPILHLEFMDDCWVQLKSGDGKILHEKLHTKGEMLDLVVTTPLHVWFGKADAVNASYNGVVVSVPVKPGFQSARFVLGDESAPGEFE